MSNDLPRCKLCGAAPTRLSGERVSHICVVSEADWRRLHGPRPEAEGWKETARQADGNAAYYRGLLDEIAVHLGQDAYLADDGTRSQDPLRAKLPELVEALVQQIKPLTGPRLTPAMIQALRDAAETAGQDWRRAAIRAALAALGDE